jgi:hypothetical protein
MPKLEIPHAIISLNVLATGRMILTTEKRVYELVGEVWTPMKFADDPEPPAAADAPPRAAGALEGLPAQPGTPETDADPQNPNTPAAPAPEPHA